MTMPTAREFLEDPADAAIRMIGDLDATSLDLGISPEDHAMSLETLADELQMAADAAREMS